MPTKKSLKKSKNQKIMPLVILIMSIVIVVLVALLILAFNRQDKSSSGNLRTRISDSLTIEDGWGYKQKNGIYVIGNVKNTGEVVGAEEIELDFILKNSSGGEIGWCKVVNTQKIDRGEVWKMDDEPSAKCDVLLAGYSASSEDRYKIQKETLEDDVVEIIFDKLVKN